MCVCIALFSVCVCVLSRACVCVDVRIARVCASAHAMRRRDISQTRVKVLPDWLGQCRSLERLCARRVRRLGGRPCGRPERGRPRGSQLG